MATEALHIISYDIDGVVLKDFEIVTDESPDFYAYQLMHTGATCVEVRASGSDEEAARKLSATPRIVLRKCLPGLDFLQVVVGD
jgi:hypothetical protein